MKKFFFLLLCLGISLAGCRLSTQVDPDKITSINIIDHNGMSETISTKDRLNAYDKTDFLAPQPYQKVMRVYGREKNGDVKSCITSYHPNGQVKQYLEAINNRAFGKYQEWYANGQIKIEAQVIGGTADVNSKAEESWLFDGKSLAYDEEGNLIASICYSKGELQGESCYYHKNGNVWKVQQFDGNLIHGKEKIYLEDGTLFQTTEYVKGVKEGLSSRYWDEDIAFEEEYKKGLLMEASYYDESGKLLAEIRKGTGQRAVFGKRKLVQLEEYRGGVQEGKVRTFDSNGNETSSFSIRQGEKHGEEISFYSDTHKPRMLLNWHGGEMQGVIKTWYENGNLESQKEISQNQKNGLLTAWYENGALMMVEEYDNDKLVKGEYYKLGEKAPVSKVEKGKGLATLFRPEGTFTRKVHYQEGKPVE